MHDFLAIRERRQRICVCVSLCFNFSFYHSTAPRSVYKQSVRFVHPHEVQNGRLRPGTAAAAVAATARGGWARILARKRVERVVEPTGGKYVAKKEETQEEEKKNEKVGEW